MNVTRRDLAITPEEWAAGTAAMIADAHRRGGGRFTCCGRGQCASHLAEEHPAGGTASKHPCDYGTHYVIAETADHGHQELTGAFSRAAIEHETRNLLRRTVGLDVVGLEAEAFA